jgi:hypothetical protein
MVMRIGGLGMVACVLLGLTGSAVAADSIQMLPPTNIAAPPVAPAKNAPSANQVCPPGGDKLLSWDGASALKCNPNLTTTSAGDITSAGSANVTRNITAGGNISAGGNITAGGDVKVTGSIGTGTGTTQNVLYKNGGAKFGGPIAGPLTVAGMFTVNPGNVVVPQGTLTLVRSVLDSLGIDTVNSLKAIRQCATDEALTKVSSNPPTFQCVKVLRGPWAGYPKNHGVITAKLSVTCQAKTNANGAPYIAIDNSGFQLGEVIGSGYCIVTPNGLYVSSSSQTVFTPW